MRMHLISLGAMFAVLAFSAGGHTFPNSLSLRHSRHSLQRTRNVTVETRCRCGPNRCFYTGQTAEVNAVNVTQPANPKAVLEAETLVVLGRIPGLGAWPAS